MLVGAGVVPGIIVRDAIWSSAKNTATHTTRPAKQDSVR
jgi:hypothetical protein